MVTRFYGTVGGGISPRLALYPSSSWVLCVQPLGAAADHVQQQELTRWICSLHDVCIEMIGLQFKANIMYRKSMCYFGDI